MVIDHKNDNGVDGQYELPIGTEKAIAVYRLEGERIVFTHTSVPPALEGKGIASKLLAGALDDVRDRGLMLVPKCPFVAAYLRRHPDSRDLVESSLPVTAGG